jgi:hypothetical protein
MHEASVINGIPIIIAGKDENMLNFRLGLGKEKQPDKPCSSKHNGGEDAAWSMNT